jgi:hypothetical protein
LTIFDAVLTRSFIIQRESLSVPKKTQPRPNRARTRARRPVGVGAGAPTTNQSRPDTSDQSTAASTPRTAATSSRPLPRRPVAPRPAVSLAFNAGYMVRDFKILAVLAPSMVVLLILAYFVLH